MSKAQAKHIVTALEHLLENIATQGITARVSDLGLQALSHYQQIVDWNGYLPPIAQTLVHERFCEHAHAHPERPAIVFRDETLTYGEVDEMSSRLGVYLQRLGVTFGVLVPLCSRPRPPKRPACRHCGLDSCGSRPHVGPLFAGHVPVENGCDGEPGHAGKDGTSKFPLSPAQPYYDRICVFYLRDDRPAKRRGHRPRRLQPHRRRLE